MNSNISRLRILLKQLLLDAQSGKPAFPNINFLTACSVLTRLIDYLCETNTDICHRISWSRLDYFGGYKTTYWFAIGCEASGTYYKSYYANMGTLNEDISEIDFWHLFQVCMTEMLSAHNPYETLTIRRVTVMTVVDLSEPTI